MRKSTFIGIALLAAAMTLLAHAGAQPPGKDKAKDAKNVDTVLTVEDLDCEACAVVVEDALKELKDVAKVILDTDEHTATVTPKAEKTLSPRQLWEAIEKVGFTPTKLVGPGGTHTKKPST